MKTYRLLSSPMVHTPGIVAWAINGYNFEADRPKMLEVITQAYGLPLDAAEALLSGEVPHTVENDIVTFTF
jgi:hypothetical protein